AATREAGPKGTALPWGRRWSETVSAGADRPRRWPAQRSLPVGARHRPILRSQPEILQGDTRSRVATHTVHAPAGRGRGGAEVDALERRSVGNELPHRPKKQLSEIHRARIEIAADQVPVVRLEVCRPHGMSVENELAE